MLKEPRLITAAGLASFLVALVATVPANVAVRLLLPASVTASGVSGTAWNGSAVSVSSHSFHLSDARWQVVAAGLLKGRVAARLEATLGGAGAVSGTLSASIGGTLECRGCAYSGSVKDLQVLLPVVSQIDGKLDLELGLLRFRNGWPLSASATANLTGVTLGPGTGPAGNFIATVAAEPVPDDGRIEVDVADTGGPLEVAATLELTPPGNFLLSGRAKARPDAPQGISNALLGMGPRNPDGSSSISLAGTF